MKKSIKILQLISIIFICCIPLFLITGCATSGYDEEKSIEYSSCVGPAGIIGCGCSCLPTECLSVEFVDSSTGAEVSGTVNYYDNCGCIDNDDVKIIGTYNVDVSCFGCTFCSSSYQEITQNDTSTAKRDNYNCLGCMTDSSHVSSKDYNKRMPRQYPYGCFGCFHNEEDKT